MTTTNLAPPVSWAIVTNALQTNGAMYSVQIDGNQPCQFFRLIQNTATADGMALIPAGSFTIGNFLLDGNSITNDPDITDANPTNVYVSAFYMDTNLVSYSQWQSVYNWATSHGYGFFQGNRNYTALGKAANHPVQTVDWYDCVKWSNARSQQAGLTPVYYTDAGFTQVYTTGEEPPSGNVTVYANWSANGYRLPTEAEWEKAARGGLTGQRFPWGNLISETNANYNGDTNDYTYDLGPNGYNAIGSIGGHPETSPVGSFAANGYGLYDMAGNVFELCWDWYDNNLSSAGSPYAGGTDPRGPASSPNGYRVFRGGSWNNPATHPRCAERFPTNPWYPDDSRGFRCVRGQ